MSEGQKATPVALLIDKDKTIEQIVSKMTLQELVLHREGIMRVIDSEDGPLSQDLIDVFDYAQDLLAGKVDRLAAVVKQVIPAHIEACKEQIKRLEWLEDQLKAMTLQAIKMVGPENKMLNGLMWRARSQKNPPKVVYTDPAKIPEMFKRCVVSITVKFDSTDADLRAYWQQLIDKHAGTTGFKGEIITEPNTEEIKEAISDKKDAKTGEIIEKGMPLDGAHIEQGEHVRFEAGSAKPALPKKAKAKKGATNE